MKKINIVLIAILAIGIIYSCQKKEYDPVLDMSQTQAPVMTNPVDGAVFVLKKDSADSVLTTFEWVAADYDLDELQNVTYTLQMDIADSNFNQPRSLASSENTDYEITVAKLNTELTNKGVAPNTPTDVSFRVYSFINNETEFTDVYSGQITLNITTYEDVVEEKFIYLLGSGTTVGWDNNAALQMKPVGEGQYAIVEHLTPGADQYIKFISVLGNWAPQWGTDGTGTPEDGPLIYRPTEDVADPDPIPVGETEGNYYIFADTIALTYETILTSGELYLVGDATPAGWDNAAGIPFEQDAEELTKFTLVTSLNAEGGMKFLEVSGAWAPQWGTNDEGTAQSGTLVYRPTENDEDPPVIPAPGTAGEYLIEVNLQTMSYTITAQ